MNPAIEKLHTRLIEAVEYDKDRRTVSLRFDDGDLASVVVEALKVPDKPIENIAIDDFRRGLEFYFADGSMHDVSADYLTWLTRADYAAAYPADETLGARVGANVRALRRRRQISQAALAERVGIQAPNLSRLESGRHVPTLDVLLRLASALGVSLSALVTPPPPPQEEVLRG
jgi:DNA-binding XRE family transcriptional regulator